MEFRPEISKEAADAGILTWLMKRLKVKVSFDSNKLYASEILSILLQNEPENRKTFGELPASIDSLLQQLAYYKRHDPNSEEEMVRWILGRRCQPGATIGIIAKDNLRKLSSKLSRALITRILDYAKIVFRVIGKLQREHGIFYYVEPYATNDPNPNVDLINKIR